MNRIAAPPAALLRPQPLGVFEGTAALILVGAGEGAAETLDALARGERPAAWPAVAAALGAVLADDVEGALAALGDGPCDRVNRLVLAPTAENLRDAAEAAASSPELSAVVAAAAFAAGLADVPPDADAVDGEFASLAATVRASDALERADRAGALRWLERAADAGRDVGPALRGRTLAAVAELRHELEGACDAVAEAYAAAAEALVGTHLDAVRAGLLVQQAAVLHELAAGRRHLLVEAVRLYQRALIGLDETRDPELFAFANMNVALAILAMPATQASDQVRLGVAVQSLRAALRVYGRESHPAEWSSGRLNLANALQYLPSGHRADNLAEAVAIYDELLEVRSPQRDPAGYARVLANQANALAHLGALPQARDAYAEARTWFSRLGDDDAVGVIDEQLANIATVGGGAS